MRKPQSFTFARRAALSLVLLASLVAAGCTPFTNFHRCCCVMASRHADAADMAGCWSGYWASHCSTHKGCLKAIITRCNESTYHVRFHATFFKFLSYEYEMTLQATQADDGTYHFTGQKDLGRLAGGMYYYSGTATATTFTAHYHCCKDQGVFVMQRQAGCCSTCCK